MYNSVDMDELRRRALAAYARTDGEPMPTHARRVRHGGKQYVLIQRTTKLIAVYRVRNDGVLKRLKRVPEGIV